MKVALVVQRYGTEVVGGAETLARKIAEKLVQKLRWDIEVLTTTAVDYRTWANHYKEGSSEVDGVKVRRFKNPIQRFRGFNFFHRMTCRYLPSLKRRAWLRWLAPFVEDLWYILQGPYSPALLSYIKKHGKSYDALIYVTYLYYPTVKGLQLRHPHTIVIPTAHDEAPFYFDMSQLVLDSAQRILASTQAEARLITHRFAPSAPKIRIAGLGLDLVPSTPQSFGRFSAQVTSRYILYLGRIGHAKLLPMLFDYFLTYLKSSGDNETLLVLAGGIDQGFSVPEHTQIKYVGFVSEPEKTSLIENTMCMVNPSAYESLSLIVAEAITLRKPVMVNGNCEVLRDYREKANTVYPFFSQEDFSRYLAEILATDWEHDPLKVKDLEDAKTAIDQQFHWDKIVETYADCVAAARGNRLDHGHVQ